MHHFSLFSYVYPTIDELAAQLLFVMSHFGLKTIIGFGIGAGANILVRFGLANPDKVGALCLVNCSSTQAGWIEWGYQSMNTRNLRSKGMTQGVLDYLMWHHFGRSPEERNLDLVQMYKSYFERSINPINLVSHVISLSTATQSLIARCRLCLSTPTWNVQTWTLLVPHLEVHKLVIIPRAVTKERPDWHKIDSLSVATLKMPVLNITGSLSPHIDDTVTFNGRLEPTKTNWMKVCRGQIGNFKRFLRQPVGKLYLKASQPWIMQFSLGAWFVCRNPFLSPLVILPNDACQL